MSNTGYALYYPYIHIQNSGWLKCAALFWNGLKRIVPSDVIPNDSDTVATLIDELDFIESVDPSRYGYEVTSSFSDWIEMYDHHFHRRRGHHRNYCHDRDFDFEEMGDMPRPYAYIHLKKLQPHVKDLLISLGYAAPGRRSYETYLKVDNEVASVYMTLLSDSIAKEKALSVVTDELYYYSLSLNRTSMRRNIDDAGGNLLNVMMPCLIPERIEAISI